MDVYYINRKIDVERNQGMLIKLNSWKNWLIKSINRIDAIDTVKLANMINKAMLQGKIERRVDLSQQDTSQLDTCQDGTQLDTSQRDTPPDTPLDTSPPYTPPDTPPDTSQRDTLPDTLPNTSHLDTSRLDTSQSNTVQLSAPGVGNPLQIDLSQSGKTVNIQLVASALSARSFWILSIFLSHLKAILTFYHTCNSEYALIVEDDCEMLWKKIDWVELITNVRIIDPNWQILKLYRNFKKSFQEQPGYFTMYLASNKNSGAVGYIVNKKAVAKSLTNISKLNFTYPEFNTVNLESINQLVTDQSDGMTRIDCERLIYGTIFNPAKIYQLNIPIIAHTYCYNSTKNIANEPSQLVADNVLPDEYYHYFSTKRATCYLNDLRIELFAKNHQQYLYYLYRDNCINNY